MAEKILIVDDDVQTLRLVGLMLERQGFKILAANNGAQALQVARHEHPDVVILDIMMPEMDGYEVSRLMRLDTDMAHIPILMFTARSQEEDRLSGFDSGADDYLTKPIHPAELTAHLRSLLSRSKLRSAPARERGYTVGVVSAKGGVGVSTVALNLAIAFHQISKTEVIAAELRPGQGSWNVELNANTSHGLNALLRMPASEISAEAVENELTHMPYGVRLLLASNRAIDSPLLDALQQLEVVLDHLPALARLVVLDIGTSDLPAYNLALAHCDELIVVTEPFPASIKRTRQLLEELNGLDFGRDRPLILVTLNRVRADMQVSLIQIQEMLGMPVAQVFPPAPEIAFQAASRGVPLVQVQIGGVVSQQFANLAEKLAQRVPA